MSSNAGLSRAPDQSYPSDIDDVDEDLWGSPEKQAGSPIQAAKQGGQEAAKSTYSAKATFEEQEAKDANLRHELVSVRSVNEAIEGVIESLNKAKSSMKTVNQTVSSASALLNTWTRILSQTEHNQRLILSSSWQGASQDVLDLEQESYAKQQAVERREAEELERRSAEARKLEEDERRRRAEAASSTSKTTRPGLSARGRATARGGVSSAAAGSGYAAAGNTSMNTSSIGRASTTGSRKTTGIGRGTSRGARGRVS